MILDEVKKVLDRKKNPYILVQALAKRADQLIKGAHTDVSTNSGDVSSIALKEFSEDKLEIEVVSETGDRKKF
jgi:DNA-directed RNA polymerase subunit K/omega